MRRLVEHAYDRDGPRSSGGDAIEPDDDEHDERRTDEGRKALGPACSRHVASLLQVRRHGATQPGGSKRMGRMRTVAFTAPM